MEAPGYLNSADPIPFERIAGSDRAHLIAFASVYELPVGRGRALGNGFGRLANALFGGWELGAVWQFQGGSPLGFGDSIFLGDIKAIPLPRGQRSVQRWFNTDAGFDRDARRARSFNLRSAPPLLSGLRADGFNSWDLSALKHFSVHERHRLQLRAEFYNALNHPTGFNAPNTNPFSAAFGTVNGQTGLPRQIQFALKYIF